VKDSKTSDKYSFAYTYQNCEIWPRLNPSVVLAHTSRPLLASANQSLSTSGKGKVELTVSLSRLHWISGQQCPVSISIINNSKKVVKTLSLSLIRSTTVFKPGRHPDSSLDYGATQSDSCSTSTTHKQVAESMIYPTQQGLQPSGWWTGVTPGEQLTITHFLLLPVSPTLIRFGVNLFSYVSQMHYQCRGVNFLKSAILSVWHLIAERCKLQMFKPSCRSASSIFFRLIRRRAVLCLVRMMESPIWVILVDLPWGFLLLTLIMDVRLTSWTVPVTRGFSEPTTIMTPRRSGNLEVNFSILDKSRLTFLVLP
jgi:hypothetical protein